MRRFLAPEVIQTSAMDCGPASLKTLLEGFGVSASYGRLREACFTGADGTSIDQIEDAAVRLGLNAEQIMLPVDHVLLDEAAALPALVVIRLASGATHFVVAWRRCGAWIQVMDPGTGRHWRAPQEFLSQVYVHTQRVPREAWREWAGSQDFLKPLTSRMQRLGLGTGACHDLIAPALADARPDSLAALDAAVRLVESLAGEGAVRRGQALANLVGTLVKRPQSIPETWWSARNDASEEDVMLMRGAVLLRVKGARSPIGADRAELPPAFADALTESARPPLVALWQALRADGVKFVAALAAGIAFSAATVVAEAIVFRGIFDLPRSLAAGFERWWAIAAIATYLGAATLLELAVKRGVLQAGRKFEGLLRLEFLTKIPRLGDSYFRSRLMSDMAERAHSAHRMRELPVLLAALARAVCGLVFTLAGIAWLYRESLLPASVGAAVAILVPLLAQPLLAERDLRARSHAGALSRFFLDALLGLTAVRAHGAERAIVREHETLLAEWAQAAHKSGRATVVMQAIQAALCLAVVAWMLFSRMDAGSGTGGLLLLAYWALSIPALGQEIAALSTQYPRLRNTLLRITEPLGAREEELPEDEHTEAVSEKGVALEISDVTAKIGGHTTLSGLNLRVEAGEHVAIIGTSGAGKSSLAGLLLGWNKPAGGELRVDGRVLDGARVAALRRATAWVSSQVHLWNESLLDNLQYGCQDSTTEMAALLEEAELITVIEKLPDGMQTPLGESGRLLSGGEGQRVRFGRSLFREGVRLAILDEAFRGLERGRRRMLLETARRKWRHATLLHITHDVSETLTFNRVLVMDGGRIIEDGSPESLYHRPETRYRALVDAEDRVRECVWSDANWRRFNLTGGRLEPVSDGVREEALC
jgi:ATP-binding cassette subfamily B protein